MNSAQNNRAPPQRGRDGAARETAEESRAHNYGFIKLIRSTETEELMSDLYAFAVLTQIAYRARWRVGLNRYGLQIGEALIGDLDNIGLTQQQYREAKHRLSTRYKIATFRTTNRGTIARLTSALVFDLNLPVEQQAEQRPTQQSNNEPTTSQQRLTKKEKRKEGKNAAADAREASRSETGDGLEEIAAEAGGLSVQELFARLQPLFPEAKLPAEYDAYLAKWNKLGRKPTQRGFVRTWMANWQPPAKKRQHSSSESRTKQQSPPTPIPPEFRQYVAKKYPNKADWAASVKEWRDVPDYVRAEWHERKRATPPNEI